MTDENADRSTQDAIGKHSPNLKISNGCQSRSLRWFIDGSLVIGLGVLGVLAVRWGLSHPPRATLRTPSAQQVTQKSAASSRIGHLSPSSHSEELSPFRLNRFASPTDLISASNGCKLTQAEHGKQSGGIRFYRVAGGQDCELKVSQITFLVSQAWFDAAGLRSIVLHPRDAKAIERFWLVIKQQAQPSDGVGEVYCWSDACVRRSNGVFGVWRQPAQHHSS